MIAVLRLLAVVVVTALLLSSCTDEPRPRFEDPSESPAPSESTSSPAAETEPWEEKSKAGAVAFARHWIDVFNAAQSTGDTSVLQVSSTRGCVSCRDLAKQLHYIYADGGSLQSDGWRVLNAALRPGPVTRSVEVVLRIDRSPQKLTDGDGKVERFPGGAATFSVGLVWRDGAWQVQELVRL